MTEVMSSPASRLRTYRGSLLVISHDLALLDQAITRVHSPLKKAAAGADPAGVLAEMLGVAREAAETLWSARSDTELVQTVQLVAQLTSVLAAVEAGAVAEADARDLAKDTLHYASTGDWVTHTAGLRRGEGKRRVVRARAVTGPLARTRQGLVAGVVSPEQADVPEPPTPGWAPAA